MATDTGPSWLVDGLAALMIATAVYCAGHLLAARSRHRGTEHAADAMHAAMGMAMAGMLLGAFDRHQNYWWEIVFAGWTAWFVWRCVRVTLQPPSPDNPDNAAGLLTGHHVQHVLACGAMVYMSAGSGVTGGAAMRAPAQASTIGILLAIVLLYSAGWRTVELAVAGPRSALAGGGGSSELAPRLTTGCQIAMSMTMSYLLLTI